MQIALIVFVCVLISIVIVLAFKTFVLKRGIDSIRKQLPEIIHGDTNKKLTVSGGDRSLKSLAGELNTRLTELRAKELKYNVGDNELKTALTNAAHDLRTPLTAVIGYLDLWESESDADKKREYVSIIRERTRAMAKLSEELFVYSISAADKTGALEVIDVGTLLKQCIADSYETFLSKNITPEINVQTPSFCVVADRFDLERLFNNIISNAIKYSDGDFGVKIKDRLITFGNSVANANLIDVNRLFDRFYTVNNGKTSTGLGLSIAKVICERIGGHISASIDGCYLTISVEF